MTASTNHHDRKHDVAVEETFPASDPVGSAGQSGARSVDVAALAPSRADTSRSVEAIEQRFASAEAAKVGLETAVREGPVDRAAAELDGATLRLRVAPEDADRLRTLLARQAA